MNLEFKTIAVSKLAEGVHHVELNRPEKRNAMNWTFWHECRQVFDALAVDADCRAIVLSGRGKGFSAGLDLMDADNRPPLGEDVARNGLKFITHVKPMQEAMTAIERCLKPSVAVVHGSCVGGGIDLLAATDIRVCTADALFCIKEASLGLAADVGTLARLPKIVGNDSIVRELALTAREFGSEEAKSFGFVSRVLPTQALALEEAAQIAGMIAANSPVAVVGTKHNLNYARNHTIQDALDYVATWNAGMLQTEDLMKAVAASMQKVKPEFSKL